MMNLLAFSAVAKASFEIVEPTLTYGWVIVLLIGIAIVVGGIVLMGKGGFGVSTFGLSLTLFGIIASIFAPIFLAKAGADEAVRTAALAMDKNIEKTYDITTLGADYQNNFAVENDTKSYRTSLELISTGSTSTVSDVTLFFENDEKNAYKALVTMVVTNGKGELFTTNKNEELIPFQANELIASGGAEKVNNNGTSENNKTVNAGYFELTSIPNNKNGEKNTEAVQEALNNMNEVYNIEILGEDNWEKSSSRSLAQALALASIEDYDSVAFDHVPFFFKADNGQVYETEVLLVTDDSGGRLFEINKDESQELYPFDASNEALKKLESLKTD